MWKVSPDEIKIPIGALSLTFDNTKNYTLKKEKAR